MTSAMDKHFNGPKTYGELQPGDLFVKKTTFNESKFEKYFGVQINKSVPADAAAMIADLHEFTDLITDHRISRKGNVVVTYHRGKLVLDLDGNLTFKVRQTSTIYGMRPKDALDEWLCLNVINEDAGISITTHYQRVDISTLKIEKS